MLLAGVDGCPVGWVVARASWQDGALQSPSASVLASFAGVIAFTSDCTSVCVDMPIGLSDDDRREADVLARRAIGPRASSVFPSPVRAVLDAATYQEANLVSSLVHREGKKISKQTYMLVPKMREVDAEMTPALQERVVESHPEVAFWELNNEHPLLRPKRTPEGQADRLTLLRTVYGEAIDALTPPRGAAWDDLYDACVLVWTASRLARGLERRFPPEPVRDGRGLRMEIVY